MPSSQPNDASDGRGKRRRMLGISLVCVALVIPFAGWFGMNAYVEWQHTPYQGVDQSAIIVAFLVFLLSCGLALVIGVAGLYLVAADRR